MYCVCVWLRYGVDWLCYISHVIYISPLSKLSLEIVSSELVRILQSLCSRTLCVNKRVLMPETEKKQTCTPLHFKSVINIAPTDILTLVSRYLLICSRRSSLSNFSLCGTTQTDSKAKCLYVLTDRVRILRHKGLLNHKK